MHACTQRLEGGDLAAFPEWRSHLPVIPKERADPGKQEKGGRKGQALSSAPHCPAGRPESGAGTATGACGQGKGWRKLWPFCSNPRAERLPPARKGAELTLPLADADPESK